MAEVRPADATMTSLISSSNKMVHMVKAGRDLFKLARAQSPHSPPLLAGGTSPRSPIATGGPEPQGRKSSSKYNGQRRASTQTPTTPPVYGMKDHSVMLSPRIRKNRSFLFREQGSITTALMNTLRRKDENHKALAVEDKETTDLMEKEKQKIMEIAQRRMRRGSGGKNEAPPPPQLPPPLARVRHSIHTNNEGAKAKLEEFLKDQVVRADASTALKADFERLHATNRESKLAGAEKTKMSIGHIARDTVITFGATVILKSISTGRYLSVNKKSGEVMTIDALEPSCLFELTNWEDTKSKEMIRYGNKVWLKVPSDDSKMPNRQHRYRFSVPLKEVDNEFVAADIREELEIKIIIPLPRSQQYADDIALNLKRNLPTVERHLRLLDVPTHVDVLGDNDFDVKGGGKGQAGNSKHKLLKTATAGCWIISTAGSSIGEDYKAIGDVISETNKSGKATDKTVNVVDQEIMDLVFNKAHVYLDNSLSFLTDCRAKPCIMDPKHEATEDEKSNIIRRYGLWEVVVVSLPPGAKRLIGNTNLHHLVVFENAQTQLNQQKMKDKELRDFYKTLKVEKEQFVETTTRRNFGSERAKIKNREFYFTKRFKFVNNLIDQAHDMSRS